MGTCGLPGYVFRDFCLKQGIEFINFCLKQGIKNRNSVLNRVGKSAIFVLNRVRVWGAAPHLPTQGYIEYPPGRGFNGCHWGKMKMKMHQMSRDQCLIVISWRADHCWRLLTCWLFHGVSKGFLGVRHTCVA